MDQEHTSMEKSPEQKITDALEQAHAELATLNLSTKDIGTVCEKITMAMQDDTNISYVLRRYDTTIAAFPDIQNHRVCIMIRSGGTTIYKRFPVDELLAEPVEKKRLSLSKQMLGLGAKLRDRFTQLLSP